MLILLLGFKDTNLLIVIGTVTLTFFMYLLNNNRQWTEATKGDLNFPTQNFQSHQQNQTPQKISDYVI